MIDRDEERAACEAWRAAGDALDAHPVARFGGEAMRLKYTDWARRVDPELRALHAAWDAARWRWFNSYADPGGVVPAYNPGDRSHVETVRLADGEARQGLIPGVEPLTPAQRDLAALEARRATRRRHEALPSGSLFDEVAARQKDLFG